MLLMCSHQGAEFALGNPVEFENDGIITDGRVVLLDQQQASSASILETLQLEHEEVLQM